MAYQKKNLSLVISTLMVSAGLPAISYGLEEIIVTSRKVEETVQTVPVAVTALSELGLERAQVKNSADLQGIAPSVSMTTGSPGSSAFVFSSIRGQGAMNASVSVDPAVATYIDGVYIARPSQGLSTLQDLERIEVLRGPQGTLFGRNTTGGAINIITKDPGDEFEGSVYGGVGNYSLEEGGFSVNVPVSESAAFRLNYGYSKNDGWADNDTLGVDIEGDETHMVNGKLRLGALDSDWRLTIAGDYNKQRDTGQMNVITGLNPLFYGPGADFEAVGNALAPYINKNYYDATANNFVDNPAPYFDAENPGPDPIGLADQSDYLYQKPFNELEAYGGSITVDGTIGDLGFKSISAYRYSDSIGIQDFDGSWAGILASSNGYESKAYSQEFQMTGEVGDNFNFITGVYWSTEDGKEFSVNQPFGLAGSWLRTNNGDITNKTMGAYIQGYLDLTDNLRLSTGYRWTKDKREVDLHNLSMYNAPGDANIANRDMTFSPNCNLPAPDSLQPCSSKQSETFTYPAWTIGLDYQLSDATFLYAKTSRASKAGGWNLRVGSVPAFDPEELTDIEVGIKTDLTENLRVNAAYFHSWVEGVQRSVGIAVPGSNPPVSTAYTVNAGDSQIDGIELEIQANLWSNFELAFNGSWMDGEYDSGTFNEEQVIPNVGVVDVDRSDEPLLQLPEFQFGISGTQIFEMESGEAVLHIGYKWIDEQFYDSRTYAPGFGLEGIEKLNEDLNKTDSYGLWYGSLTFNFNNPNLQVSLWGRNLANKEYLKRTYGDLYADLGFASAWVGEPRTYGLKVTYNF